MYLASRRVRAVSLLVFGILVFCDVGALAVAGFTATVTMLLTIGFVEGRFRAVGQDAIVVASAFVADFLWLIDWEPFNRSDDYEAIPQTPFVVIGLPIPMALIAVGVAAGVLWRRVRSDPAGP